MHPTHTHTHTHTQRPSWWFTQTQKQISVEWHVEFTLNQLDSKFHAVLHSDDKQVDARVRTQRRTQWRTGSMPINGDEVWFHRRRENRSYPVFLGHGSGLHILIEWLPDWVPVWLQSSLFLFRISVAVLVFVFLKFTSDMPDTTRPSNHDPTTAWSMSFRCSEKENLILYWFY